MDTSAIVQVTQTFELIPLLKNIAVGTVGLFTVMWVNLFFVRRITLFYEIDAWINLDKNRYSMVFVHYFVAVTYLMLVQIAAIIIWAFILNALGLAENPGRAALFAGSCYTTMGIISDDLPHDWKLLAVFISLSGFFAIAITTASMLSMGTLFRRAWRYKHAVKIRALLKRKGIQLPEGTDINALWENQAAMPGKRGQASKS